MLIDYEYAGLNFKGYDLACYIHEMYIDYSHDDQPYFKVYPFE